MVVSVFGNRRLSRSRSPEDGKILSCWNILVPYFPDPHSPSALKKEVIQLSYKVCVGKYYSRDKGGLYSSASLTKGTEIKMSTSDPKQTSQHPLCNVLLYDLDPDDRHRRYH